ncbi:olfactory receptor 5F1-like [Erythrolamprus reginae]|uniref:olfactory receptor 5F1-like n=1 Tax=Erythrolamprus reginae TaxID=121349 RepID=UPI00396C88BE
MGNNTQVTEFILTGLTEDSKLQLILFGAFSAVYTLTVVGNLSMIILIRISPSLHTPMYFFLTSLSLLDICYSSCVTPKFLSNLLKEKKIISYEGCLTQLYFYALFATTECYILAVMAYDRYVAICSPLLYMMIMSQRKYVQLLTISCIAGIINTTIHTMAATRLSFCGPNLIKSFYCEGPPLFALSCSDVSLNYLLIFVFVGFNLFTTSFIVLTSYAYILVTILTLLFWLKLHSAASQRKAFSTCTSHLTVVTIFYGCFIFMYMRPGSRQNLLLDQIASVFYVVVTPMLNPLIYSMRNQEVRGAFRNILERKFHVQQTSGKCRGSGKVKNGPTRSPEIRPFLISGVPLEPPGETIFTILEAQEKPLELGKVKNGSTRSTDGSIGSTEIGPFPAS